MVSTKNITLPRPASCVYTAAVVPPSTLCVEKPLQSLGPAPATAAPAPAALPPSAAVVVRPLISLASEAEAVPYPTYPCAESSSASLVPASALNASALTSSHLDSDPLLAIARSTASDIQCTPCLTSFLAGNQHPTLYPLPATANHLASPLLKDYAELGFPTSVGSVWPLYTIKSDIATGPHVSTLTPEAIAFCRQELLERAQRGFSIFLLVDVALLVFGNRIRISLLVSVDLANRKPRLICNSFAAPGDVTPAVNASTNKSTAPNAMQFGTCLPRFLQKIWGDYSSDVPMWISKWDISDAFHRCLLRPADIGAFTYIVPPLPSDIPTLLCIDFFLPMGWVNSTYMFYVASETGVGVDNGYLLDPTSAFEIYPPTSGTYSLATSPTSSAARLHYVDVYMDDFNCDTQVDVGQQQRTSKLTLRALKQIFPSLPSEVKDSVSLKICCSETATGPISKKYLVGASTRKTVP